ncbi:hypothetical protein V491_06852, partial [Pseudogymnoascus sp. VKM F-3775]
MAYYGNHRYEQYDNGEANRLPAGIFFTALARVEHKEPLGNKPHKGIKQKKIGDHEEINYAAFGTSVVYSFGHSSGEIAAAYCAGKLSKEIYLPLLEVSVEVEVVGTIAWSTLTQTFTNRSKQPIKEATYSMPLYDKSTVTSFVCTIGSDKILKGIVKPKEKAKAEFKEAVAKQQVAALLQEHTPEVFETSVGNIPAETTIKVEICYITELKPDLGGDGVLVTIPTSVAPRYGTVPGTMGDNATKSLAVPEKNGLQIKIRVSSPVAITKIESQTHPVSIEMGSHGRRVIKDIRDFSKKQESQSFDPKTAAATLSDRNACLGKDFVLLIHAKDGQLLASRAISEPHPNILDHSALMVSINLRDFYTPNVVAPKTASEIIFVADRSGSMGECMETLKTAMKFFLKSLPNNCIFNICSFGTKRELMWRRSRPYNQENVDIALDYVATCFSADMGGTEILKALKHVVKRTEASMNTEIITLTDGEVWDTPQLFDFIQSTRSTSPNQNTRFFCLGIGEAVSHSLVAGIGRYGGGLAEVVAIDPSGDWMQRVVGMLRAALTPSSWTVDVTLDGVSISEKGNGEISYIQAPHKIPDLHAFSRSSVYFFLNEEFEGKVAKIQATSVHSGETFTAEIPIEKSEIGKKWVHQLAAKAVLGDLESGQSWIHDKYKNITDATAKAEADELAKFEGEKIGIEWNISSKWTSFIVVDEKNSLEKQSRWYQAGNSDLAELTRPRFEPKFLDHTYQGAFRQSPATPSFNSIPSRRQPVMSCNIEYNRHYEDPQYVAPTSYKAPTPAMNTQYTPPTRNAFPPQRPRRDDYSEFMSSPLLSSRSADQSSGAGHSMRDPAIRGTESPINISDPALASYGVQPSIDNYSGFTSNSKLSISPGQSSRTRDSTQDPSIRGTEPPINISDPALVSYGADDITIAEPVPEGLGWATTTKMKKKKRRAPVEEYTTWDSGSGGIEETNTDDLPLATTEYQWRGDDERMEELEKQMALLPSLHNDIMDMRNDIQVVGGTTSQDDLSGNDSTQRPAFMEINCTHSRARSPSPPRPLNPPPEAHTQY